MGKGMGKADIFHTLHTLIPLLKGDSGAEINH